MALTDINTQGHVPGGTGPGAQGALAECIAQLNALAANMETLLEKLDADAGVTDADYESTVGLTKRILVNGVAPTAG